MKNQLFRRGMVTAWLLMAVSCGRHNEPSPIQPVSDSRTNGGALKTMITGSVDKVTEDQMNGSHEYLDLIMHNSTVGDIDGTEIVLGRHSCTFGIVGMGVSKGYLDWTHSVSSNAMVRWRDSTGTRRESMLEISKVYDPNLAGHLTFTIAGTNVTVKFSKVDGK